MFEFRTGLPGSGKSLSLVRDIYWKLVYTNRIILTTLTELDVDRLSAYIAKQHPGKDYNISRRLFFIPKTDTATFYRYRGLKTFPPPPPLGKTMSVEEKDAICEKYFAQYVGLPGVDYVLTEAHRHFKADTWSAMSDVVTFYASQHRHLDDNAIIETQVPKMVVVQFRDLAEICCEMQNHYRQRFGMFQKVGRFVGVYYYGVPKPGTAGVESHRTTFLLDKKGLASCYATRGAITGVGGATPETENVKKGLPFWMIPLGGVALLAVVTTGIWLSGDVFKWVMNTLGSRFLPTLTTADGPAIADTPAAENAIVSNLPGTDRIKAQGKPSDAPPAEKPPVRIKSALIRGQRAIFILTDGRILTDASPELAGCTFDRNLGVLTLSNGTTYNVPR